MNQDYVSKLNVYLTHRRMTMADVVQTTAREGTSWKCTFTFARGAVEYSAQGSGATKKIARNICAGELLSKLSSDSSAASAAAPAAGSSASTKPQHSQPAHTPAAAAAAAAAAAKPVHSHASTLNELCQQHRASLDACLTLKVYRGQSPSGPQFKATGTFTHPATGRKSTNWAIRTTKAEAKRALLHALWQDCCFSAEGGDAAEQPPPSPLSPAPVPAAATPANPSVHVPASATATSVAASAGGTPGADVAAEEAAALPLYTHGRTVIETADVQEVAQWIHPLVQALEGVSPQGNSAPVVTLGFDTEWHGFKGVGSPTVILQLATAESVLIVHTLLMHQQLQQQHHTGLSAAGGGHLLSPLGKALPGLLVLLTHPAVRKVGRSMTNDAAGLIAVFGGDLPGCFKCNAAHGYVDATAGTPFKVQTGAPALVASVLGRFYKKQVTSWKAKWRFPLSPKELEYVADDACIPFDVFAAVSSSTA